MLKELAPSVVMVLGLWLAVQMLQAPLAARLPVSMAIRLAPNSTSVLARAAEVELVDGEAEDARALAAEALTRAPFNVRALRVFGLTEAAAGRLDRADQILTLAGNWSLRDDPAHAWLVENRLRRGDYGSAFAHADTLARRRADLRPQLFQLYTIAALQDPRALPHLTTRLALGPPWRTAFFEYLIEREDADPVIAALAVGLQQTEKPLRDDELQRFYLTWLGEGRLSAILFVRDRLNRPNRAAGLVDGDFDGDDMIEPFAWRIASAARFSIQVIPDDLRSGDNALRVEYRGRATEPMVQQLLVLLPGRYRLGIETRFESGADDSGMSWVITCPGGEPRLLDLAPPVDARAWTATSGEFVVPSSGCPAQHLMLLPRPSLEDGDVIAWYDRLSIARAVR